MKLFGTILITTTFLFAAEYNTSAEEVVIEGVTWSTKNLDVSTFRNGDVIPEAKSEEEWTKAGEDHTPAWCYYDNDAANGKKYGRLYNFYAVSDERGLAPEGWHVASYYEWVAVNKLYGGVDFASVKLKAVAGWVSNENGTNESGITALPGGCRYQDGGFSEIGSMANFWTSTYEDGSAWFKLIGDNSTSYCDFQNEAYGMSVRCVKD